MTIFTAIRSLIGALTVLTTLCASADAVKGNMQNNGPDKPLHLTVVAPGQPLDGRDLTIFVQPALDSFLRRMRTGDSITVQGSIDDAQTAITIDSVDEVGLQELLGTWRTQRWEIFEFQNYNLLNLYVPTAGGQGGVNLEKMHSLKYILTPEQQANRFSIFMSDDRDVRMGFIEVGDSRLTLTVTDFKTGQITDSISLSPVHLQ